ncbi:MAG: hypothetical protein JKY54_02230 [Flavobacteriales bacterium]|nr:hypothetical protein [Flavobacteriales bacterium]
MNNPFLNPTRTPNNRMGFLCYNVLNLIIGMGGVVIALMDEDNEAFVAIGVLITLYSVFMKVVLINNRTMSLGYHWWATIAAIFILMVPVINILVLLGLLLLPPVERTTFANTRI